MPRSSSVRPYGAAQQQGVLVWGSFVYVMRACSTACSKRFDCRAHTACAPATSNRGQRNSSRARRGSGHTRKNMLECGCPAQAACGRMQKHCSRTFSVGLGSYCVLRACSTACSGGVVAALIQRALLRMRKSFWASGLLAALASWFVGLH